MMNYCSKMSGEFTDLAGEGFKDEYTDEIDESIANLCGGYVWMDLHAPYFVVEILQGYQFEQIEANVDVSDNWDYKFYDPSKMFKSKKSKERYDYLNMKAIDIINEMKECEEDSSFVDKCFPSTVMCKIRVCGSVYDWWCLIEGYVGNHRKDDYVLHNATFELAKIGIKGLMAGCPKILGGLIKKHFGSIEKFNETYGDKK